MDPKEEKQLVEWYNEVDSDISSPESEKSDPYEDRSGEYDILDPTYQPEGSNSDTSSVSSVELHENNSQEEAEASQDNVVEQEDDNWVEDLQDIPNFNFDSGSAGIQIDIDDDAIPLDVFQKLWNEDVVNLLLLCSNKYGEKLSTCDRPHRKNSRKAKFTEINANDLNIFIALTLLRAQIGFPAQRKMFSLDPLYYHPIFSRFMSGRRYEQILRYLCCYETDTKETLHKVLPLLNLLLENFQKAYYPEEHISLDESMLLFRGRLHFKQYIKNKKAKYGIKFFELCSTDGYVFNIEIYKGKQDSVENESKIDALVLRLMKPYLGKGHHLVMDNYYNSVNLSQRLLDDFKSHTTGTLRSNRKNNPRVVTMQKLKKGQHIWRRRKGVYVSKWRDNRDVLVLTTKYHPKLVEVRNRFGQVKIKPQEIAAYNLYMSGVDRCDQIISYYSCPRKTIRWYKKVIFHLLDVSLLNAYIIYRQKRNKKIRFLEFRESVIRSLLGIPENVKTWKQMCLEQDETKQPREEKEAFHFPEQIPPPQNYKRSKYYMNCRNCTNLQKRIQTSWRCSGCDDKPALCPGCFSDYHKK